MSIQDGIYEVLAKELIYLSETDTSVLDFLSSTGYEIDTIFDDPVTDLQAVGLVSVNPDNPPVLVFRGTESQLDNQTGIELQGVGFSQFEANQEAIGNWLAQISQDTTKNPNGLLPDVTGQSLGGALTQRTAVAFSNLIGEAVTFNSPGIDQITADSFNPDGAVINVTHYVVNGDFVSLSGEAFISGTVFLQSFTDPQINPRAALSKHNQPVDLLTNPPPGFTQQEISVEELNDPNFGYYNDSDYAEFLAAMGAVNPQLAEVLTTRAGVEGIRQSGLSFFEGTGLILSTLDPSQDNYLVGDDQDNTAYGLDGNDTILGNGGRDVLFGGTGNDSIDGGAGRDKLVGDIDDDILTGGAGRDTLVGGKGDDILTGGGGADVFQRSRINMGIDIITDFQVDVDRLSFSGRGFGDDLVSGSVLTEDQFTIGTGAVDSNTRFIYDDTTGDLFFDTDGTGEIEQVQLATLSLGLAMTNASIYISS